LFEKGLQLVAVHGQQKLGLEKNKKDIYLKPDKVLSRLQSVADRNSQKVGLEENQIYSKVDCHPDGPRPAKDKSSHRLAIRDAPCNRIVSKKLYI